MCLALIKVLELSNADWVVDEFAPQMHACVLLAAKTPLRSVESSAVDARRGTEAWRRATALRGDVLMYAQAGDGAAGGGAALSPAQALPQLLLAALGKCAERMGERRVLERLGEERLSGLRAAAGGLPR